MRLFKSKGEAAASIVVAALLFIALGYALTTQSDDGDMREPLEVQQGSWITLTSDEAIAARVNDQGRERYSATELNPYGEWAGVVRVRIDEVRIYDSLTSIGIPKEELLVPSYFDDWDGLGMDLDLCLIELTVDHSSASPITEAADEAEAMFSWELISQLEGCEMFDILWCSGGEEIHDEIAANGVDVLEKYYIGIAIREGQEPQSVLIGDVTYGVKVPLKCEKG